MINLKSNIWIEGFITEISWDLFSDNIEPDKILFSGLTSEIIDHVNYVERMSIFTPQYRDYKKTHSDYFETAKESFESACNKKYCVIYKK